MPKFRSKLMNVVDSSISINATQLIDMLEWIMLSNESTCCFYFLPIFQVQISRCLLLTPRKISCNICYFHCGFYALLIVTKKIKKKDHTAYFLFIPLQLFHFYQKIYSIENYITYFISYRGAADLFIFLFSNSILNSHASFED